MGTFVNGGLTGHFVKRNYVSFAHMYESRAIASGVWKFVGISYDRTSGEQKLWIDGVVVKASNIGAGHELATQDRVRMGGYIGDGRHFKGRIAHVQVYNIALTQEQIQELRGKNRDTNLMHIFFLLQ